MGRLLAIDYGKKRTGLAVTDPLQLIATGLKTVPTSELFAFLHAYLQNEDVEAFVVGEAKQMNNQPSESAAFIEPFVVALEKQFPEKPVYRTDERFSSKIASQTIAQSGMTRKARQNKSLIDTVAAVILLQSHMSFCNAKQTHNSSSE